MQPSLVPIPIRSSNRTGAERLAHHFPRILWMGFFYGSLGRAPPLKHRRDHQP